ncbi:MAG: hypothetical protein Q9166_006084 [cf. Caloplaca sp. 2 TL-2023]
MARNKKKKSTNLSDNKFATQSMNSTSPRAQPSRLSGTKISSGQVRNDAMPSQTSASYEFDKLEPRPTKRLKTNTGSAIPSTSATSTTDPPLTQDVAESASTDSKPLAPSLPLEIQHLLGQYDFSTMSIISSSKIHQKVRNLIARVENFTFADVNARPGVVILGAKASSASKLISVVEIAKGDIAKRGGKWYEYSKLQSELLPLKEKQKKQPLAGKILANPTLERSIPGDGSTGIDAENGAMASEGDDSDDEGVAFETTQHQPGAAVLKENVKVRAIPIMTIYLSCVPVPGLKDLLG